MAIGGDTGGELANCSEERRVPVRVRSVCLLSF
jgi:hypothetical protein